MQVSRSGYYSWRTRAQSVLQKERSRLIPKVKAIHRKARGSYGARRMSKELQAEGESKGILQSFWTYSLVGLSIGHWGIELEKNLCSKLLRWPLVDVGLHQVFCFIRIGVVNTTGQDSYAASRDLIIHYGSKLSTVEQMLIDLLREEDKDKSILKRMIHDLLSRSFQ
jgi:hypothetical protein